MTCTSDVECSPPLHEALPRNAEFEQNILFLDVVWLSLASDIAMHFRFKSCLDVILETFLGIVRINIAECCFFEFILFCNLLSQMQTGEVPKTVQASDQGFVRTIRTNQNGFTVHAAPAMQKPAPDCGLRQFVQPRTSTRLANAPGLPGSLP